MAGFVPQHGNQLSAIPYAGLVMAHSAEAGVIALIRLKLENDALSWTYSSYTQSIDNTISYHTLLRITTDSIMDGENMSSILRGVALPPSNPFNPSDGVDWVIRAVGRLSDDNLVSLAPDRAEGLAGLEAEIRAIFTMSPSALPRESGYPVIVLSKACS